SAPARTACSSAKAASTATRCASPPCSTPPSPTSTKPSASSTNPSPRSRADGFMDHWYIELIRLILAPLFPGLPTLILAWALWRWFRSAPRIVEPAWRSYVAIGAIGCAGVSSTLWLISLLWARVTGGFRYYDPVLLSFYQWGCLTGLIGFLISFIGKGKLRWPACGLSSLMVFLWLMAASTE